MRNVRKTVFISYRRTNAPWAIAISQYLTHKGFDVFIDFDSINSGDFEQIITESIHARAHFLVLLTPSAIENCTEPEDWLRREIEIALDSQRNIIPILLEGFDFDAPETKDFLTGKLDYLQKYNALKLYADYFDAGMDRLCKQFLDIALKDVHHPLIQEVSDRTKQVVEESQREIAEQQRVEEEVLSAQEWFEKAYKVTSPEERIRLYTKAIELDPKFVSAYNNRGNSYNNLGQYEKAIKDLNKAIQLDPKYAFAYNNRGISYSNLGQYIKADEDYNRAIQLDPEDSVAFYNRGNNYSILGQYEKAIEYFTKAIQLDPEYTAAYYNQGSCYFELGQYEKAIEDYNKAIQLDSEDARCYNNRGNSYFKLSQYEKAIEDYSKTVQLNPKYADAFYNTGKSYSELGQYEKAIENYNKAVQLNPEDAAAYYNRGYTSTKLGQYEEAMKDFNYAIELNPKNGFPYYKKAYLYTLQGNIATACFLLHQAFKLDFRRLCKLVKTDPDFNSIREDERFKKLIAEYCSGC